MYALTLKGSEKPVLLIFHRKEDLGLYRNELNYMQICWTIGYVIGQIPSNLILTYIRPSIWIPSMEVNYPPLIAGEQEMKA